MKSNKILKKSLISTIVFTLFVIIVFYFIFKEVNLNKMLQTFNNTNKGYLFIAIFA